MRHTKESVLNSYHKLTLEQARLLINAMGKTDILFSDFEAKELQYFDHIVFICAMNQHLRVTYRMHFLNDLALEFWALGQKKSKQGATRSRVVDSMKEFCNQLTGRVRHVLNGHRIELGQSLPVYVSGFNELFFSNLFESTFSHSTKVAFSGIEFILSSNLEFKSEAIIETLAKVPFDSQGNDASGVELF